ncbi:NAD-P-binding protein [Lentinula edodes]|nr:NAD-P-binding protein [Lentinula edodes]
MNLYSPRLPAIDTSNDSRTENVFPTVKKPICNCQTRVSVFERLPKSQGFQQSVNVSDNHSVYPAISPETYFSGSSEAFRSKVVLVFGASKGIGLSISSFYTRAGAKLAMISRSEKALAVAKDQVISEAGSLKPDVLTVAADVVDTKAVEEAVRQVIEAYDRLDIVIANAGISSPWTKPFVKTDPDVDWWKTVEVNLRGVYNVAHYSLPHLEKTNGAFVAVSSMAAQINLPFASAYVVSKAALNRFIEYVSIEHPGVKSFSVHPGSIQTEMALAVLSNWESVPVDTLQLPAATILKLTDGSGRFDWLSGKFVSANWDLEEVERDWKEKIVNESLLVTRIVVD